MASYNKKLKQKTFMKTTPEELDSTVNAFRDKHIVTAVIPNQLEDGGMVYFINTVIYEE